LPMAVLHVFDRTASSSPCPLWTLF
jgi:hypothetical protein